MLDAFGNTMRLIGIARSMARHDALWPLQRLGVARPALFLGRLLGGKRRRDGRPGEKLARALEELGPVAIKLGQALAVRSDLVGEQVAQDLTRLQDQLPPFPFATARKAVEEELGQTLEELFAEFSETPVAAASIAQVHRATTHDGREVAIKILRPDIEARFDTDLKLLYWIARLAERAAPATRRLKPLAVVREFEKWVRVEMDLRLEAASASELAENFPPGNPENFRVPRVHWDLTGRRVLATEWIDGVRIDDLDAIERMGLDRRDVTARSARVFFLQVFRDGFFHADMHPGNMFLLASGELVPVDFGIMGRVDMETRRYLADMLSGFLRRQYGKVADVHFRAGYVPADQDREAFTQALRAIGEPLQGLTLNRISLGKLLAQLFQTTEQFAMQTRPELLLLQKTLLVAEGVGRKLDPEVNMWVLAQPLIEDWMFANRGPEARIRQALGDALDTMERLPRILRKAEDVLNHLGDTSPREMARERRKSFRDSMLAASCVIAAAALLAAVLLD